MKYMMQMLFLHVLGNLIRVRKNSYAKRDYFVYQRIRVMNAVALRNLLFKSMQYML